MLPSYDPKEATLLVFANKNSQLVSQGNYKNLKVKCHSSLAWCLIMWEVLPFDVICISMNGKFRPISPQLTLCVCWVFFRAKFWPWSAMRVGPQLAIPRFRFTFVLYVRSVIKYMYEGQIKLFHQIVLEAFETLQSICFYTTFCCKLLLSSVRNLFLLY